MTANVSEPEIVSLQEDGASVETFAAENQPEIPHQAREIQGRLQDESNIQNLLFVCTKPRPSQKRPGAVAEIDSTAAKRLASDVTLTENGEAPPASSRSQTNQVELESRDSEAHNTTRRENGQISSSKLENILEDAATLRDVINFTHDEKLADACDVMKDQYKNPVALQIGYIIMFYVNLVMTKIYVKFPGVVRTLVELIQRSASPSSEEILCFARKLYNKGENVQAILFCEIASSFYEQEKALKNVADGIADCVHLLAFICTNMMSSDSQEDIAIYKPFIKTHVTRAMRAMVKEILGTDYQDRVPWCLHYIECVLCSVEDWDFRETIILQGWDLKRELPDKEEKYKIFAILQNNLGHNYEQTSRYQLAKDHYQRAHDAYVKAEDMDDKEREENLKRCDENMDRVSKLISNVQE